MLTAGALALLAGAIVLATWLDRRFGEPANRWHPVAWLGRALALIGARLPSLAAGPAFVGGALAWTLVVVVVALLAWAFQAFALAQPAWLALPLLALALKPAFAWRMLDDEVAAVDAALADSAADADAALAAGRARLARLCSRDVTTLDAVGVRETAIETLAENLNDSLVAALFWALVFGLPGAWVWRAVNTMDAMWGYRGRWEWAGKWAARADDLLGWLPARLTAALLWRPGLRWSRIAAEARLTPSPNGGWPMATMALGLGVALSKPGVYVLNCDGRPADGEALAEARRVAGRAAVASVALTAFLLAALATAILAIAGGAGAGAGG